MQRETDEKDGARKAAKKAAEAAARKLTELEREMATVGEKEKHLKVRRARCVRPAVMLRSAVRVPWPEFCSC